jgi:thiol-disulfide isomerase/thioredoxin
MSLVTTFSLYGWKAAWSAEKLKLKGSRIILITILLGCLDPFLYVIVSSFENGFSSIQYVNEKKLPFNFLQELAEKPFVSFGIFLYPLILIIITARLAAIEHKTDTWKLIENQPLSRFSIWLTKWCMAVLLAALAVLMYFISSFALGYVLSFIIPINKAAYFSIPYELLISTGGRLWLSGWGIITIQLAFSMLVRSTIWPILIGLALVTLSNILAIQSVSNVPILPYALPRVTVKYPIGNRMGGWLLPAEWQSIVWLLWAPVAFLLYLYRSSFKLSLQNKSLWRLCIISIGVFAFFSWGLQQPIKFNIKPGKTIITGKIHKNIIPDSIDILRVPIITGSQKIPVNKDGTFYIQLPLSGSGQPLMLSLSRLSSPIGFYASDGDSAYVDWRVSDDERLNDFKLSGTVLASDEYARQLKEDNTFTQYSLERPEILPEPNSFYKQLIIEWKNRSGKPRKFRTPEGLGLSDRQVEYYEKLLAARYISYAVYDYPKLKKIQLPEKKYESIRNMLQPLLTMMNPLEDILLGSEEYTTFLRKKVRSILNQGANEDSAYNAILLQHSPSEGRNLLLFELAQDKLKLATDSLQRAAVIKETSFYQNLRYKEFLIDQAVLYDRLVYGKPAPLFYAFTSKNEKVTLASLHGKYVLIDIWASWCLPCKKEYPYFERLCEKYKDQPIQFLALSVDANSILWEQEIMLKTNRIIHWRIDNPDKFIKLYGIRAIPHYLLIDPNGKFINIDFPRPSQGNFEIMLRQVLKLKSEEG